jgi:hypothetical protein
MTVDPVLSAVTKRTKYSPLVQCRGQVGIGRRRNLAKDGQAILTTGSHAGCRHRLFPMRHGGGHG